jgi:cysteine desulfurase/selenocysteine lyase
MKNIRPDFPILETLMNQHQLIYFDNAATTLKPWAVINALRDFYAYQYATVNRGMYTLAEEATARYEEARKAVAQFIGAAHNREVIFTKSATEGINLVASGWAARHLQSGDEILLTEFEHHANLLPWQSIAQRHNVKLVFIPVTADGNLDYAAIPTLITSRTRLAVLTHVSNALGTHVDVQKIIPQARAVGAHILIDAAQSVPHERVNVQELDADFLVFSGHKMLGPTGIGVVYIKEHLHEQVAPLVLGGGMVFEADFHSARFLPAPYRYEAGTPPVAEAIGLHAAITYLQVNIDFTELRAFEASLTNHVIKGLQEIAGVTLYGPLEELKNRGHLMSFAVTGIHAHDVATVLSNHGICVRAGHYCAQPLAKKLGIDASVRVSFYCYNTHDEVDYFLSVISKIKT